MQQRHKYITLITCFALILSHCKDRYTSPYVAPDKGYLVVEGFIAKNGPTKFVLSRTMPIAGGNPPVREIGASIQVEGDDNSTYPLKELGNGSYGGDTLPLNPAAKYRLHIHTTNGSEYRSDYTAFRSAPAIDSISWAAVGDNLEIYVNAHDPSNATRYYQWAYEETWQYFSTEQSLYRYQSPPGEVVRRNDDEQVTTCWGNRVSTSILLGTTVKLSSDVIYRHLLNKVVGASLELSEKYSIIVWQYSLTEEAFNYLSLMQKNSEALGSIFDAQPVSLKGNIHCLNNPVEQVIGFVSAGTIEQQRIFIDRTQLPSRWYYNAGCTEKDRVVPLIPDSLLFYFGPNRGYTPVDEHRNDFGFLDGWIGNRTYCVDCRAKGGVTTKPTFWPN